MAPHSSFLRGFPLGSRSHLRELIDGTVVSISLPGRSRSPSVGDFQAPEAGFEENVCTTSTNSESDVPGRPTNRSTTAAAAATRPPPQVNLLFLCRGSVPGDRMPIPDLEASSRARAMRVSKSGARPWSESWRRRNRLLSCWSSRSRNVLAFLEKGSKAFLTPLVVGSGRSEGNTHYL